MTAFLVFSRLNVQGFGEKELNIQFQGKEDSIQRYSAKKL